MENQLIFVRIHPGQNENRKEESLFPYSLTLNCTSEGHVWPEEKNKENHMLREVLHDIEWFCSYTFPIERDLPDPVKMRVTEIHALSAEEDFQGNCTFSVKIFFTNSYTEKEILNTIKNHVFSRFAIVPAN